MDTYEARSQMKNLAQETLDLLEEVARGDTTRSDAIVEVRKMELEARGLLVDAGYPGEAAWRGLQRTGIALQDAHDDLSTLTEAIAQLSDAVATLSSLTTTSPESGPDFRIIG